MKSKTIFAAGVGALLLTSTAAFAQMTDAQLLQKVQEQGYQNAKITRHEKKHVDVQATKDGKKVKLEVDLKTGAVRPDRD